MINSLFEIKPNPNKTLPAKSKAFLDTIKDKQVKRFLMIMTSYRATCFLMTHAKIVEMFGTEVDYSAFRFALRTYGKIVQTKGKCGLFVMLASVQRSLGMDHSRHLSCIAHAAALPYLTEAVVKLAVVKKPKQERTSKAAEEKIKALEAKLVKMAKDYEDRIHDCVHIWEEECEKLERKNKALKEEIELIQANPAILDDLRQRNVLALKLVDDTAKLNGILMSQNRTLKDENDALRTENIILKTKDNHISHLSIVKWDAQNLMT